MNLYRWDLDKTYLDTDFESLRGLVRTATEPAFRKRTVPGAMSLIRALGRRPGARITILSGSPEQMRGVLERKLQLDGVRYESLTLKDNLQNLRKGRLRAIRGQFGYKLPHLLQARVGLGPGARETLFGDDAEADALVYAVYSAAVSGRIGPAELSRAMEAAGAYANRIDDALESLARISRCDPVENIFIRLERGRPMAWFDRLGGRVIPVHSWWQAALVLADRGHLAVDDLNHVCFEVQQESGVGVWEIAGLTQDIVRRGHVSGELVEQLALEQPVRQACLRALELLGPPSPSPSESDDLDYLALIRSLPSI